MPQRSMPAACQVWYKLRSQRFQALKLGVELSEPNVDSDSGTAGVQNEGTFQVEFNPADEKYDLFYRTVNENGAGRTIRVEKSVIRVTLNASINATTTTITTSDPGNNDTFSPGDPIQVGSEYMVIAPGIGEGLGVEAGNPTTLIVEERGAHGSDAAAHSSGATLILLRYTVPSNSITLAGKLDSAKPIVTTSFVLSQTVGKDGNAIDFAIQLPETQIKSLRKYQLQLSTIPFVADTSGTTGLKTPLTTGTGTITQGGQTLVTTTSLSGKAGDFIYTHEGIDNATGEITYAFVFVISSVAESGGNWTATITGDKTFRLRTGVEDKTTGTVNFIVASDWVVPGNTATLANNYIGTIDNIGGVPGDPTEMGTQKLTIAIDKSVHARVRLWNFNGTGPWMYWDSPAGSATLANSELFVPNKREGLDFSFMRTNKLGGARIELNLDDGFKAVDSNGHNRVQIDTDGDLITFKDAAGTGVGSLYGYPADTLVIAPPVDNTKDFSVGYAGRKFHTTWILATRQLSLSAHPGSYDDRTGFVCWGEAGSEAVTGYVDGNPFMWNGGGNTYFYDSIVPSGTQDLGLTGTRWNALWVGGITSGLITLATGDIIPSGAGDSDTFIGNAANYFNRVHTHRVSLKELGTPGTPATGTAWLYLDSADGDLKIKFDSGNVATIQVDV